MTERHELMGGKIQLYRRPNSNCWHCSASVGGKQWRASTKEESLSHAKDFAEDWFLELRGKKRAGELQVGHTFQSAAKRFVEEIKALIAGERSSHFVAGHEYRLSAHLLPFLLNGKPLM
jgi:hypothetical protein